MARGIHARADSNQPMIGIADKVAKVVVNVNKANRNAIKKLMRMVSLTRCPMKMPSRMPTMAESNRSNIVDVPLLFFAIEICCSNPRDCGDCCEDSV